MPIPELGLLPSGEPVTAGIAILCTADEVRVLDWGPDSSASYAVAGARGMAVWRAFARPGTREERRLSVMLALERARLDTPALAAP